MDRLRFELRQVLRRLSSNPGGTLAILLTLTAGFGLATAVFALADPFLLRALPYTAPEQLVLIETSLPRDGTQVVGAGTPQVPTIQEWARRTDLFDQVAAFGPEQEFRSRSEGGATLIRIVPVSRNFFQTLGVPTVAPTQWTSAPETPGQRTVLLSASMAARLGASPLLADNSSLTVVGTLPAEFVFPQPIVARRPAAVAPADFGPTLIISPGRREPITVIARVRVGVTVDQVAAALSSASGSVKILVTPLTEALRGGLSTLAFGTLATSLLITLGCLANVLNLLVAGVAYRTREFTTRRALGASTGDLLRQVAGELGALAILGLASGLGVARLILAALTQVVPAEYVAIGAPAVTLRIGLFSGVLAALFLASALVAVWSAMRVYGSGAQAAQGSSGAIGTRALRNVMLGTQTCVAALLLVGGGLILQSYVNLFSQDVGVDKGVALVSVMYPRHETPAAVRDDVEETLRLVKTASGTAMAAVVAGPLLDRFGTVGGFQLVIGGKRVFNYPRQVSSDYFATTGAAVRAGRALNASDVGWGALVVNESFARRLAPGAPLGQLVGQPFNVAGTAMGGLIVGIVQDTFDRALDLPPTPQVYRPLEAPSPNLPVHFLVKTDDTEGALLQTKRFIARVNRDAAITFDGLFSTRLAGTVNDRSFATLVLTLFAGAGLAVTGSGLLGMVAFTVARRTREIAIRRALGASRTNIVSVIVRDAALASLAGTAAGLLVGRWTAHLLENQVYGLPTGDWNTIFAAAVVMCAVAIASAIVPARKALKLSPTDALRID